MCQPPSTLGRAGAVLVPRLLSAWVVVCASCAVTAEETRLEEVLVTAQKRSQSQLDVPLALSVLDSEMLLRAGVDSAYDVSRLAPSLGVYTNTAPVQSNFRLRRMGNLGNIPTFEPSVGVFIDGAYRARSVFAIGDLVDLERVEVIRGPQSVLYGKSVTAGLIGLYTAAPGETFRARTEIGLGSVDGAEDAGLVDLKGMVGGPVGERLRGGLALSRRYQQETMVQALAAGGQEANGVDRKLFRGQLQWDATDALSLRAIVGGVDENDRQQSEDIFIDPDGFVASLVLPTLRAAGLSDTCSDNDPHNRVSCLRRAVTTDLSATEVTLLTTYAPDHDWTLSAVTSWDRYEHRGTMDDAAQVMAPVLRYHDTQAGESFQQDVRLASAFGQPLEWLVGAYYYSSEFERGDRGNRPVWLYDIYSDDPVVSELNQTLFGFPAPLPFATAGQHGFLDARLGTDYSAVYGHVTWNLGERLSLVGGLRWQREEKRGHLRQWVDEPGASIVSLLLAPAAVRADGFARSTDDVSWSLTPLWSISSDLNLYATVANGFKSGGFNVGFGRLPIADREFGDEDILHYELGLKARILEGRGWLNASAFVTVVDDYQDAAFVGAGFSVANAEQVKLEGVELDGTILLTDTLAADFSISYADLVYAEQTRGLCAPGQPPDSPTTPGACDLSGRHPINAPEGAVHAGLDYETAIGRGSLFARLDWTWSDEYNTGFSADPRLVQQAYNWVSLRAGVRWSGYQLTLWAENLLDETVVNVDGVLNIYAGDLSFQSYFQAPRSYGLSFSAEFE